MINTIYTELTMIIPAAVYYS